MRARPRLLFAIALQICVPIAAYAASAPPIDLQATAETIRASHLETSPATRLVFDEQRDGAPATAVTIIVSNDFLDIATGTSETVYDFKLKRIFALDGNTRQFSNGSLYAAVAFRAFERGNRRALAGALQGATLPEAMKPFWVESQLGLIDPTQARPAIQSQRGADGTVVFSFEGEDVVRLEPSSQTVPPMERSRLARALRYFIQVHPAILDEIVATGRVPGALTYIRLEGTTKTTVALILRSADRIDSAFPLPPGFVSIPLHADPRDGLSLALNGIAPQMLQAAARQYSPGPRTVGEYHMMIGDAINSGATFQAVLLEFELLLQHGQQAVMCPNALAVPRCYSLREIADSATRDQRSQAFFQALQIEQQDPDRAISLREGVVRSDLGNATALDILLANTMSAGPRHNEALPYFLNAIRANPYVASFYKDIGDHFMRDYRMDLAWFCFDLGRNVPGADVTGNFQAVDRLEQQLVAQNPSFF